MPEYGREYWEARQRNRRLDPDRSKHSGGRNAQNARLARIGVECDPLETVMHRMALFAIAVLLLLVAAEIRLSRGDNNYSEPPPPDLWEHAQPPGRWSPSPVVGTRGPWNVDHLSRSVEQLRAHRLDESPQFILADVGRSGVRFDFDADGDLDQVAWTEAAQTSPSSRSTAMATGASAADGS